MILQQFEGSFSAVSKPIFASKYSYCSIVQALQELRTFAPLQTFKHFANTISLKSAMLVKLNFIKICNTSARVAEVAKFCQLPPNFEFSAKWFCRSQRILQNGCWRPKICADTAEKDPNFRFDPSPAPRVGPPRQWGTARSSRRTPVAIRTTECDWTFLDGREFGPDVGRACLHDTVALDFATQSLR